MKNIFCVLYSTPQVDIGSSFSLLDNCLDFVTAKRYILFMGGDLNISICSTSKASFGPVARLESYWCADDINCVTHVTCLYASTIYLFISNAELSRVSGGTLNADISDYLPIFCSVTKTYNKEKHTLSPYSQQITGDLDIFRN